MQKVWKDGEKIPFFHQKRGKVFGRTSKGRRIEALFTNKNYWTTEELELRRPEKDWKKEEW